MKGWINFDEHPEVFPSRRQGRRWCHQPRNGAWRGELLETACRPWDSNSTILSVEISDGMELSIKKWRWPMVTSKLRDIFNIRFAPGGFPLDLRYEPRRGGWWISCQPGQRSISSSKALRQVATRGRWPSFWRVESTFAFNWLTILLRWLWLIKYYFWKEKTNQLMYVHIHFDHCGVCLSTLIPVGISPIPVWNSGLAKSGPGETESAESRCQGHEAMTWGKTGERWSHEAMEISWSRS